MRKGYELAILSLGYGWTVVILPGGKRAARKLAAELAGKGNLGAVRLEDQNHKPLLVWEREEVDS